ncbi:MAG: hypothetical protein CVU43_12615 [Chloroflexi bacterium HGW-Chloroflexi-5]|jgi:hypothetical protein|nr:MAG: hypothetical protein CVU43_12615 [Chloroflexi bacterium HGW-Chloroflexi-5]PKP09851.1 MAG: hypothetical protein CVU09_09485 [Bacteroidetes bacterium HGW-Bacteroidetes-4]
MGNILTKIYEAEAESNWTEMQAYLEELADDIRHTIPNSKRYHDTKFLFDNQEKIIRNRKFIELLGD